MIALETASHRTPLGRVQIALQGGVLCALTLDAAFPPIAWQLERRFGACAKRTRPAAGSRVARALDAYFAGELAALGGLDVDPGGSEFQRAVWRALRAVPAGETVSYGALARAIGRPGAARAVGAACGANPIWLVVPCHRAIGADGHLVGYAAGLERKGWLLAHERANRRAAGPAQQGRAAPAQRAAGERSTSNLREDAGLEVDAAAHPGDARAEQVARAAGAAQ
jgi:methylated-DNA-[protein]-cysteine S-methyltransferase